MDFSSLARTSIKKIVASYDIACHGAVTSITEWQHPSLSHGWSIGMQSTFASSFQSFIYQLISKNAIKIIPSIMHLALVVPMEKLLNVVGQISMT